MILEWHLLGANLRRFDLIFFDCLFFDYPLPLLFLCVAGWRIFFIYHGIGLGEQNTKEKQKIF